MCVSGIGPSSAPQRQRTHQATTGHRAPSPCAQGGPRQRAAAAAAFAGPLLVARLLSAPPSKDARRASSGRHWTDGDRRATRPRKSARKPIRHALARFPPQGCTPRTACCCYGCSCARDGVRRAALLLLLPRPRLRRDRGFVVVAGAPCVTGALAATRAVGTGARALAHTPARLRAVAICRTPAPRYQCGRTLVLVPLFAHEEAAS